MRFTLLCEVETIKKQGQKCSSPLYYYNKLCYERLVK